MAENQTQPTTASVPEFLSKIEPEQKRIDCQKISQIMEEVTGEKPILWGQIVGFGKYHYKYESGREGDSIIVGFSPRKQNITLYLSCGFGEYDKENLMDKHLQKLGKHSIGKGCLYFKTLSDVDESVLRQMIKECYDEMKNRY